jgi:hypothetical protein
VVSLADQRLECPKLIDGCARGGVQGSDPGAGG